MRKEPRVHIIDTAKNSLKPENRSFGIHHLDINIPEELEVIMKSAEKDPSAFVREVAASRLWHLDPKQLKIIITCLTKNNGLPFASPKAGEIIQDGIRELAGHPDYPYDRKKFSACALAKRSIQEVVIYTCGPNMLISQITAEDGSLDIPRATAIASLLPQGIVERLLIELVPSIPCKPNQSNVTNTPQA